MLGNRLPHTGEVVVHVRIGHAKNTPTLLFEIFGAPRVVRQLFGRPVRDAIDLKDELGGNTGEVSDVGANGVLTAETGAI
nr:hypothetical protein [Vitreimonas sp.]